MTVFNRDLHNAAEVGPYVGVQLRPRCASCLSPNPDGLAKCPACHMDCPEQPTRLVQGRLTDGTLRWFHLARYALLAARGLNKLADWLEGKNGR